MTGSRQQLAAALVAALRPPALSRRLPWLIIPSPDDLTVDPTYQAGLLVYRTEMTPLPNRGATQHTFEVVVMVPQTKGGGSAEDALDAAADRLIEALDPLDWLAWTKAERTNFQERYPAWKFDVTVHTTITEE
ncbi:hypothetical protein C5D09_06370 [Rathayibacter sp. AY1C9]|uniref:hypothetical protein n=1 Tax=Rathayibacter sp. AY1C9 TaxID=2080541 RepID=UPI000CE76D01|nr:hypothetical protein [Rathayibacter sp. AY1C9]PPH47000.1 hypothetical protein C5D09_06370 [Rathayibacter sp. AY1C9]